MQPKFLVRFIRDGGERHRFLIPSRLARRGAQLPDVPGSYIPEVCDVMSMMEAKHRKAVKRHWDELRPGAGCDILVLHLSDKNRKPIGSLIFKLEQHNALS